MQTVQWKQTGLHIRLHQRLLVLWLRLMKITSWEQQAFCSKTKYARTYHKGAKAALNDRRTAEKILITMEDLKNEC